MKGLQVPLQSRRCYLSALHYVATVLTLRGWRRLQKARRMRAADFGAGRGEQLSTGVPDVALGMPCCCSWCLLVRMGASWLATLQGGQAVARSRTIKRWIAALAATNKWTQCIAQAGGPGKSLTLMMCCHGLHCIPE